MEPKPLEVLVGERLRARQLKLATAESCTGGLIGHLLTNVPGSSEYFLGSIVAYAYEAKRDVLGVGAATLEKYGAVSEQVAGEMARNVCRVLGADVGLAVTGIAGPGGATPQKPVGLTWVGLHTPVGAWAQHYIWDKDRVANKAASAQAALEVLLDYLEERAMDIVEVTARFDVEGRARPISFVWRGQAFSVEMVGRRWESEDGQSMLVMAPGNRVFQLKFVPAEQRWYLLKAGETGRVGV